METCCVSNSLNTAISNRLHMPALHSEITLISTGYSESTMLLCWLRHLLVLSFAPLQIFSKHILFTQKFTFSFSADFHESHPVFRSGTLSLVPGSFFMVARRTAGLFSHNHLFLPLCNSCTKILVLKSSFSFSLQFLHEDFCTKIIFFFLVAILARRFLY